MAGLRDVICLHELRDVKRQYVPLGGNKIHYAAKKIGDPDRLIDALADLLVQSVTRNVMPIGELPQAKIAMSYDQSECESLSRLGVNPIVLRLTSDQQHWRPYISGAQWLDHNALRRDMAATWLDGQPLTNAFKSFLAPFLAAQVGAGHPDEADAIHQALKAPHQPQTGLYIPGA